MTTIDEKRREDANTTMERLVAKTQSCSNGCIEYTGALMNKGYGDIYNTAKKRYERVHRIIWEHHYGPIPKGLFICHRCDNRKCVNINHLFMGTHQDNMDDMVSKNRQAKGIQSGPGKLCEDDIHRIRSDIRKYYEIAKDYDVCRSMIGRIKLRKTWEWLPIGPDGVCCKGPGKLTKEEVKAVIRSDKTNQELANKYCVHVLTIQNIRNGKTWKHVHATPGEAVKKALEERKK